MVIKEVIEKYFVAGGASEREKKRKWGGGVKIIKEDGKIKITGEEMIKKMMES